MSEQVLFGDSRLELSQATVEKAVQDYLEKHLPALVTHHKVSDVKRTPTSGYGQDDLWQIVLTLKPEKAP